LKIKIKNQSVTIHIIVSAFAVVVDDWDYGDMVSNMLEWFIINVIVGFFI